MSHIILVLMVLPYVFSSVGCSGAGGHRTPTDLDAPRALAAGGGEVPNPELQAELVAQLHAYIGDYRNVAPTATKELKVSSVSLSGADDQHVYVRFAIQVRERVLGGVVYTVSGRARGRFRLGEFTSNSICVAAPPEVTYVESGRISAAEFEGAKDAIRDNFPQSLCVPLYPTITATDAAAEEAVALSGNRGPIPNTMRFIVTLSNLSARTVSVRYLTADGTATSDTDYIKIANTLIIPSLSANGTIGVRLRNRQGPQGDRSFFLNLREPVNGVLADSQATGLIIDYPGER
jgi:hypothetical protein